MKKVFRFFDPPSDAQRAISDLRRKPETYWIKLGDRKVLELFKHCVRSVPAYRQFLKDNNVRAGQIQKTGDIGLLPATSKSLYLKKYKYNDLFAVGSFHGSQTFSATSGSTGEPFYIPRNSDHDRTYEYMAENFLREQFEINKKTTLAVMGFALGVWIGGIFTYKVMNRIAEKGYKFSMIPTGTNKHQFLMAVKRFGHMYDQVILMGYPPFIKDVLDSGLEYGVHWRNYSLKILMAAEGTSQKFREYVTRKAFLKNPLQDMVNMYGTVELGTMAYETPIANLIRKLASKDRKLFKALFPSATNIPTLAQYYPHLHYFEEVNGELLVSGEESMVPLIRYKTSDLGGVITFGEMIGRLRECGVDIYREIRRGGLEKSAFKLPFVYLFARSDFGVVFRGATIYPEEIKDALDDPALEGMVTGRFCIMRKESRSMDQVLEINTELKKGMKKSGKIKKLVLKQLMNHLCKNNSEFNNEYVSNHKKTTPKVVLWPYLHPKYFGGSGKQKWVR